MQQLPQERLIVGVAALGAVEAAYEHTLAYVKSREAFGKPLFALQNTRFELAEIATVVEVMRSFVEDAIERHVRGELDVKRAAMVKLWCSSSRLNWSTAACSCTAGTGTWRNTPSPDSSSTVASRRSTLVPTRS